MFYDSFLCLKKNDFIHFFSGESMLVRFSDLFIVYYKNHVILASVLIHA